MSLPLEQKLLSTLRTSPRATGFSACIIATVIGLALGEHLRRDKIKTQEPNAIPERQAPHLK